MATLARKPTPARTASGGWRQTTTGPAVTAEGGAGWATDPETELFKLAVTYMHGSAGYYESAGGRHDRLVRLVTVADPGFVAAFLPWLRSAAGVRTGAIIAAVHFAHSRRGSPGAARAVVDAVCQRGDEPAEVLAYSRSLPGKTPRALLRGVADAARRLYTARSYVRWDSSRAAFRMADVLRLAHPKPRDDDQGRLFSVIVADREGGPDVGRAIDADLPWLAEYRAAARWSRLERETAITRGRLPRLFDWRAALSWAPKELHRRTWELVVPQSGTLALLRNLRNLQDAGVSDATVDAVIARLTDPEEVAAARIWPHHVAAAWAALHPGRSSWSRTLRAEPELSVWDVALDRCAAHAARNVPALPGRTLVMVDTSGSMQHPVSDKSQVSRALAAAMFGAVVAHVNPRSDVWAFAETWRHVPKTAGGPLVHAEEIVNTDVGLATNIWPATLAACGRGGRYDRVVIFTDEQHHPSRVGHADIPCPIYVWNLAGHATSSIELGADRVVLGGWSDAAFKIVSLLEDRRPVPEIVGGAVAALAAGADPDED